RARQVDESRLRSAEVDAGTEEKNQKLVQAAIVNMKEDFSRIQVLRNDIARNLVAHKPLDYSLVAEQAGEINSAPAGSMFTCARMPPRWRRKTIYLNSRAKR